MARDVDITILLLNCEYIFAVQNNFMLLQAFLEQFQRRINLNVEKENVFQADLMPIQRTFFEEVGGPRPQRTGNHGGGDCHLRGGMTSSVMCPPPPKKWKPWQKVKMFCNTLVLKARSKSQVPNQAKTIAYRLVYIFVFIYTVPNSFKVNQISPG